MLANSLTIARYIAPRLGCSNTAVCQHLGRSNAVVGSELVDGGLLNVYDIDGVINYFETLLVESSLVNRYKDLWQDYITNLEGLKYDLYRRS